MKTICQELNSEKTGYRSIYHYKPEKYDVIIVLGGYISRAAFGLGLYSQGLADHILISGSITDIQGSREVFSGIDDTVITCASATANTYCEAQQNYTILSQNEWRRALVITNAFHYRRVRDVYYHLRPTQVGLQVDIFSCPNPPHIQQNLLYHSGREYIKSLYYWVWYGCVPHSLFP